MSKENTIKDIILGNAKDLARDFLYYGRKECEDLHRGVIQQEVGKGTLTKEEIIQAFREELDSWW